ncbi:hypothetical protein ES703_86431 [subsurface metagenome]
MNIYYRLETNRVQQMGEQIPKYYGQYEEVKESILKDAPPSVIFRYLLSYEVNLKSVSRGEW